MLFKMSLLFRVFLSYCRTNKYLIIGICLGLSLSLFLSPHRAENEKERTLPVQTTHLFSFIDEYEPRLNVETKPQHAQKAAKVFVRPRYYSTELGMRDKLFVGIITSLDYLHSRAIALNKTIAHIVDKVRYFITIPEGMKPNVSIPGIVGFTDTRTVLKPFHVIKYINDNYLEDYDYYYLVKDSTYINARKLKDIVSKISVSQDVHMGVSSEIEALCSLDAGILLSNLVVREIKSNLDWCVKNIYSDSDDINFGRCILHSVPVPCMSELQGQTFRSTKLASTFDFENSLAELIWSNSFDNSVSVYPIYDHLTMYKMNAYFAMLALKNVQKEISKLRKEILETSYLAPEEYQNISWPIGNQLGNRALGRYDTLQWIYFNETHTFLETDFENFRNLQGSAKTDINHILNTAVKRISRKYNGALGFKKLINGYYKFDASRGMDYILDLSFIELNTGKELLKRIEVCKPLGKVEILPVPYVTENTRINMILIVDSSKKEDSLNFMMHYAEACMEKKDKTFLLVVLLYDPNTPSKGMKDIYHDVKQFALSLSDKYKQDQLKVTWLSIRLPVVASTIELDPMLKIAIADLSTKKFSPESLILFVETSIELRNDYLNRVRMNTINQWQIYSPIPFFEFHPDVAYADETNHIDMDINRNHGRYDEHNFNSISFYVKDYISMRKTVEAELPFVHTDKDISLLLKLSERNVVGSIFELFVKYSDLHSFRAIEPLLKIRHKKLNCAATYSDIVFEACEKQRSLHLGHRGQLARLILDYREK
ncbi:chondroitin sulfate glucuronyltransferase [Orussus abietinus]|uniref:chondroitin sulfate glucuronyltransferase n=1 Tax=Orussus abietinus TaxID=222816 RepID=UPI000625D71A|nr:chondroitin sulfate glucuronyltransferase [Orussus abietinus]